MAENHRNVGRLSLVGLLDDEGHAFEGLGGKPRNKIPGGRAPWIGDGKHEQDEVGGGQETFGDFLVALDDRVGAGGIHEVEIAQETDRAIEFVEHRGDLHVARRGAVLVPEHPVGFREDVHAA